MSDQEEYVDETPQVPKRGPGRPRKVRAGERPVIGFLPSQKMSEEKRAAVLANLQKARDARAMMLLQKKSMAEYDRASGKDSDPYDARNFTQRRRAQKKEEVVVYDDGEDEGDEQEGDEDDEGDDGEPFYEPVKKPTKRVVKPRTKKPTAKELKEQKRLEVMEGILMGIHEAQTRVAKPKEVEQEEKKEVAKPKVDEGKKKVLLNFFQ